MVEGPEESEESVKKDLTPDEEFLEAYRTGYRVDELARRTSRAFVVDDDHAVRKVVARIVRSIVSKEHVQEFRDGKEAIEAIETHKPDLIITDYVMTHLGGGDILRYIESLPESERPLMIIISGTIHLVRDEELSSTTIVAVLNKPFDTLELTTAIHKALMQRVNLKLKKVLESTNSKDENPLTPENE